MSLAPLQTFELKQGDSWVAVLVLTEDDGTTPIDLTGWSVEFSIAKDRRRTPSWTWIDDPDHASITDAEAGTIGLALDPSDSRAFGKLGSLPFEVTIQDAAGYRLSILEGTLAVRLEVVDETGVAP